MNTVWIVSYECINDPEVSTVGVYAEFEDAARYALNAAHQQVQEYKVHTEAQVRISVETQIGLAIYTVYGHYDDNPDHPWDVYVVRRYEVR